MFSAVTDSNSFSQIKKLVYYYYSLAYCIMGRVEVIMWVLGGTNMTAAMSSTFLRTSVCVIISVHNFFSWVAIIMEAFGMCGA